MAMTDLTLTRRSMTARMISTVITVLTVAVAVGLMLLLVNLRRAGSEAFNRGSGNMHLLISRDSSPLTSVLNSVFLADAPPRYLEWSKVEQIRDSYPLEWMIPTQMGDSYRGQPVIATTPEFFLLFKPDGIRSFELQAGTFFDGPWQVVVGAAAARETGLKVGDEVYLTHDMADIEDHEHGEFEFHVVGVLKATGSSQDRALYIDVRATWILHAHDRRVNADPSIHETTEADLTDADRMVTALYARLPTREGSNVTSVSQQVYDMLRRDTSVTVAQPGEEVRKLEKIVGGVDQLFFGMAGVVMVGSGLAILLALYNSMEQRRRQIAILRVLGCSRPRILMLVLTESALLGVFGVLGGILASLIGGQIAAGLLMRAHGLVLEPGLDARDTLIVAMATIGLACIAGLFPAVMAYRTAVARHLRPIG